MGRVRFAAPFLIHQHRARGLTRRMRGSTQRRMTRPVACALVILFPRLQPERRRNSYFLRRGRRLATGAARRPPLVRCGDMATRKRKQYDDKFRASAVVMLEAAGYPKQKGALRGVAEHLHVPAMTLSRWFKGQQNPPPNQIVTEKRDDLTDMLNSELSAIFQAMNIVRDEASYRDLGTVAGILIDKKQLLTGEATSRSDVRVSGLPPLPDDQLDNIFS